MKYYLAARYSRKPELLSYANVLKALGHEITSEWLYDNTPETSEQIAERDVADVKRANALILFTEAPRSTLTRGGRLVEFGIALATDKAIIVIGPSENDFVHYKNIKIYASWQEYLNTISPNLASPNLDKSKDNSKLEVLEKAFKFIVPALYENMPFRQKDANGVEEYVLDKTQAQLFLQNFSINLSFTPDENCVLKFTPKKPQKTTQELSF